MIQCKVQILLCLIGLLSLSCVENPIWDQVTTGKPPIDGTWEGPSVGVYPDRKTKMIVEGGGTRITYFEINPGTLGMGMSEGNGWKIVNSTFEITYFADLGPGMWGYEGKVTGKFRSSEFVEGEYDLREIRYPYSYGSRRTGTWRAQWQSSSTEY